jgi:hypothetical protein
LSHGDPSNQPVLKWSPPAFSRFSAFLNMVLADFCIDFRRSWSISLLSVDIFVHHYFDPIPACWHGRLFNFRSENAHAIGIIKTITMKNAINYGST